MGLISFCSFCPKEYQRRFIRVLVSSTTKRIFLSPSIISRYDKLTPIHSLSKIKAMNFSSRTASRLQSQMMTTGNSINSRLTHRYCTAKCWRRTGIWFRQRNHCCPRMIGLTLALFHLGRKSRMRVRTCLTVFEGT